MAIFIGYEKRGWPGLKVAGCAFILPATIIVGAIASAYVRYGTLPQVNGVLYALKPVVIAVVIQAFWKLARTAVKTKWPAVVGLLAGVLYALGVHGTLTIHLVQIIGQVTTMAIFRPLRLAATARMADIAALSSLGLLAPSLKLGPCWR